MKSGYHNSYHIRLNMIYSKYDTRVTVQIQGSQSIIQEVDIIHVDYNPSLFKKNVSLDLSKDYVRILIYIYIIEYPRGSTKLNFNILSVL
jgi:hypothetical protein